MHSLFSGVTIGVMQLPAATHPTADRPLFVSIAEAARLLSVSERLMYDLTDSGEIPAVRVGRRRKVVPRRALDELVELAMDGFDPSLALARLRAGPGT